ncbi:MAG TPA: serine/threonine-protein kinase [Coriobacteriia bacterium]|jgi:serine/threonine-protein kinase
MRYRPGQTIDHYEIVEELGEGAYAETYKARDTNTGRVVMLKSPNPLMFGDPQVYQRFKRETEIAQRLDDANIQRSLELHEDGGEPYLVLEYVQGENLRRKIQEYAGRIPIGTTLDWMRQLAHAIAYLHSKGITHRDLKPENVLVSDDGTLKIVDFGTAYMIGARRLTWRNLTDGVGTPDYMSPEQIQGERGDPRSDVYAWGVIAYELLTGRVPFEGDNWLAVMGGHLQRTPERIRTLRPEVPPALEAVVLTAMRRYPQNRYRSAEELITDLGRLDTLDPASFDLSPEKPMGGMSAAMTPAQLWLRVALIALGFFALLVLVIVFGRGFR